MGSNKNKILVFTIVMSLLGCIKHGSEYTKQKECDNTVIRIGDIAISLDSLMTYLEDLPKTEKILTYYKNPNKLQWKIETKNGTIDGKAIAFSPKGSIVFEGVYIENQLVHGLYYKNDSLQTEFLKLFLLGDTLKPKYSFSNSEHLDSITLDFSFYKPQDSIKREFVGFLDLYTNDSMTHTLSSNIYNRTFSNEFYFKVPYPESESKFYLDGMFAHLNPINSKLEYINIEIDLHFH